MRPLEISDLSCSYSIGNRKVEVLKNLNFSVDPGEFVAIHGPSGSGKSTLFYVLGCLYRPTSGKVLVHGVDVHQAAETELAWIRNRKIGFVFQQFHLLARTSVLDNILLPCFYPSELSEVTAADRVRALELAEILGLEKHLSHFPNQLSGGQQQRVAIARALMNQSDLILADEPTGNLDSKNAKQVLEIFRNLSQQGKTIVLITHDSEVSERCNRIYHLRDGAFVQEKCPPLNLPLLNTTPHLTTNHSDPSATEKFNFSGLSVKIFATVRIVKTTLPWVLDNLFRNRVKTLLTMLGVIIGISAVLTMVTLGSFTQNKILESYEALGINQLVVHGERNTELKAEDQISIHFNSFDLEKDLMALKRIFPDEVALLSPLLRSWQNSATAGGRTLSDGVKVIGISHEYLPIANRSILLGKAISPFHLEKKSPVCLIGIEISQKLFSHVNPIGQVLSVSTDNRYSYPCQVIGVLESQKSVNGWLQPDRQILIPFTYFQTVNSWWRGEVHEFALQIKPDQDVEEVGEKIKAYFSRKYGKSGNFRVDSDSTLVAQMKKFLSLFTILLGSIAFISLLVGGIGINNMMLVSVSDRLKEIGLRKALGATDSSIRIQILMESVLICSLAGLVGVLLGFIVYELLIFAASRFVANISFEWILEPGALFLSVFSILAVGIGSGFIPALRAEKLQVIECLRSD